MNLLVIGIGHEKDLIIGIGSNFSYRASLIYVYVYMCIYMYMCICSWHINVSCGVTGKCLKNKNS